MKTTEVINDMLVIDTGLSMPETKEQNLEPLTIYTDRHPMLSAKVPEYQLPIPNVTMTNLVQRLKLTMKKYAGMGLSANQCGIMERVFVIGTDQFQIACINPRVTAVSEDLKKEREGCLSYPALYLTIARPTWVEVEFYLETGELKQMRLDGLTARCFLHELDHLNGIKMVQHVGKLSAQMAEKRAMKMIKKITRIQKNANGIFV